MSFILDALKKSETDRQRQTGPALFEVKVAPPKAGFPVWAIAIVALLVINMVIVGWLLLRRSSKATRQTHNRRLRASRHPQPPAQRGHQPTPRRPTPRRHQARTTVLPQQQAYSAALRPQQRGQPAHGAMRRQAIRAAAIMTRSSRRPRDRLSADQNEPSPRQRSRRAAPEREPTPRRRRQRERRRAWPNGSSRGRLQRSVRSKRWLNGEAAAIQTMMPPRRTRAPRCSKAT